MSDPVFLEFEEVLVLHRLSIERYGGTHGMRDEHGARAAVEQPKQTWFYGRGDHYEVAAAYAFHVAQAQAFLDGNKRTGIGAALAFLERNGVTKTVDWTTLYDAMIAIAERRLDRAGLARRFRELFES